MEAPVNKRIQEKIELWLWLPGTVQGEQHTSERSSLPMWCRVEIAEGLSRHRRVGDNPLSFIRPRSSKPKWDLVFDENEWAWKPQLKLKRGISFRGMQHGQSYCKPAGISCTSEDCWILGAEESPVRTYIQGRTPHCLCWGPKGTGH